MIQYKKNNLTIKKKAGDPFRGGAAPGARGQSPRAQHYPNNMKKKIMAQKHLSHQLTILPGDFCAILIGTVKYSGG